MNRLRDIMRDRRVAAALAIVALLLVGYRLLPLRGKEAHVERPATESGREGPEGIRAGGSELAPVMQESSNSLGRVDRPEPEVAWSWQRNPFLPVGSTASAAGGSGLSAGPSDPGEGRGMPADLRGTVVAGSTEMAIFGSRLVPVGGKVGDWTVKQVDPYRVVMHKGSETRVVEMFKPAISGSEGRGGKR
ncbi:MAG: hypothetical protein WBA34_08710 [Candidatus Deferrimicrobiaceae bacterium]